MDRRVWCARGVFLSLGVLLFFFFLMIRRPPSSTLFPYPPLFRSPRSRPDDHRVGTQLSHQLGRVLGPRPLEHLELSPLHERADAVQRFDTPERSVVEPRSEEHTSELQSRLHLVCRLLLEKNKSSEGEGRQYCHSPLLDNKQHHRHHTEDSDQRHWEGASELNRPQCDPDSQTSS